MQTQSVQYYIKKSDIMELMFKRNKTIKSCNYKIIQCTLLLVVVLLVVVVLVVVVVFLLLLLSLVSINIHLKLKIMQINKSHKKYFVKSLTL